jgi:hypothetical protein
MTDKCYSAQDIQAIAETNSESPAIGSPPVSHFQDEEPIQYEAPTTKEVEIKQEAEDSSSLPANLETRRKKRESGSKLTIRRMSVFSSPEDEAKENHPQEVKPVTQVLPIRAGAKRKLGSRDDDAKPATDFTFSRKTSSSSESAEESSAKEEKPKTREPIKPLSRRDSSRALAPKLGERKALGEKSINTDPIVSPKKTTKTGTIKEEKEALKKVVKATEEATKPARTARDRKSRITPEEPMTIAEPQEAAQAPAATDLPPPPPELEPEPEPETKLPPKTPFTTDIFSAPSTESSSRPPAGRDTPPPDDLNARPGRRARAQVNYAEPSLAAKMRRPTKELLDAVGKDGRPLHGMIVNKKGVEFKLEDGVEGSAWRTMSATTGKSLKCEDTVEPGSPLSKKSGVSTNEALKVMRAEPDPILPSAASQAIAALIADSKSTARRRSAALRPVLDTDTDIKEKEKRGSSIYDFASSSPPRSANHTSRPSSRSSDREDEGKTGSRLSSSRRHSSLASLTATGSDKTDASTKGTTRFGGGAGAAGHKRSVSGTSVGSLTAAAGEVVGKVDLRASRRRSMML